MRYLASITVFPWLLACSTSIPLERGPLLDLVLRPRAGYIDKLTNKRCAEFKKNSNVCTKFDVKEFDFNDDATRKMLRDLKFVCNVRGERYVPCETSRGLCQLRKDTAGIWPFKKTEIKVNKYLSLHDDFDMLIGANTYCASIYSEVGSTMFP